MRGGRAYFDSGPILLAVDVTFEFYFRFRAFTLIITYVLSIEELIMIT
jgi:hypothetical protein